MFDPHCHFVVWGKKKVESKGYDRAQLKDVTRRTRNRGDLVVGGGREVVGRWLGGGWEVIGRWWNHAQHHRAVVLLERPNYPESPDDAGPFTELRIWHKELDRAVRSRT